MGLYLPPTHLISTILISRSKLTHFLVTAENDNKIITIGGIISSIQIDQK